MRLLVLLCLPFACGQAPESRVVDSGGGAVDAAVAVITTKPPEVDEAVGLTLVVPDPAPADVEAWIAGQAMRGTTHLVISDPSSKHGDAIAAGLARSDELGAVRKLVIRGIGIRAKGAEALAATRFAAIEEIDLGANILDAATLSKLAKAPWLARLRSIDVTHSSIDAKGLVALLDANFDSLEVLILRNNRTGSRGAAALAQSTLALRELDLASNDIGDAGVRALARSNTLATIERLDLTHNGISAVGVRELTQHAPWSRVENVNLRANKVGDEGAAALASDKELARVRHLDLSGTGIGDKGAVALASSQVFGKLDRIGFLGNDIGVVGAKALAAAAPFDNLSSFDVWGHGGIWPERDSNMPAPIRAWYDVREGRGVDP